MSITADESRQPGALHASELHERLRAMRQAQQGWHAEPGLEDSGEKPAAGTALPPAGDHAAR